MVLLNSIARDDGSFNSFQTPLVEDSSGLVSILQAGVGQDGYLSSADWNTFNNKLDAETDPVFLASPAAGIVVGDISNWDTAYGWGDHASAGYQPALAGSISGTENQVNVTANSNSVGENITFSLPQDIHTTATPAFTGVNISTGDVNVNSSTAMIKNGGGFVARGDIANDANGVTFDVQGLYSPYGLNITSGLGLTLRGIQGLTFTADAYGISQNVGSAGLSTRYNASNRLDTTVSSAGIVTFAPIGASAQLYLNGPTRIQSLTGLLKGTTGVVSAATAGTDYLIAESDPVFLASPAAGIASGDISNWGTAYGWGNHASAGYLTAIPTGTRVKLRVDTTQTIPHATWTTLALDTSDYDVLSEGDLVNNQITVGETGYYLILAAGLLGGGSGWEIGEKSVLRLRIDQTEVERDNFYSQASVVQWMSLKIHTILYLTAGQDIDLQVYQNSDFAQNFYGASNNAFIVNKL